MRTSVTSRLRWSMRSASTSTSFGRSSWIAISRATSAAESRQRRQRLVTSFSERRALGRELAEDAPGVATHVAGHVGSLAAHPAGDGDRGDRADLREAVFDERIEHLAGLARAVGEPLDDLLGARVQLLSEAAQIVGEVHGLAWVVLQH